MGLYHGHYQETDASPHFAGDGSRIDSHRWYRLCNRYEGCSWVLRDDDKNAWVWAFTINHRGKMTEEKSCHTQLLGGRRWSTRPGR